MKKTFLATWRNFGSAKFTRNGKDESGTFHVDGVNHKEAMKEARAMAKHCHYPDTKIVSLRLIK